MPLVFVHGVNVRYDPESDPHVEARNAHFRSFALPGVAANPSAVKFFNPYWGGEAAKFPWNHGGLPIGDFEAFGADDLELASLVPDEAADLGIDLDVILPRLAERSLPAAIDALWHAAAIDASQEEAAAIAHLGVRAAAYADENETADWARHLETNEEFASELLKRVIGESADHDESVESFGGSAVVGLLRGAANRLRTAVVRARSAAESAIGHVADRARQIRDWLLMRLRLPVHRTLITFLGDAFVYIDQRNRKRNRAITDRVGAAFTAAAEMRTEGDPLIVVAHSMGGNIAYDLLTSDLRRLEVDVLVTVGSQVAVFEELKLFASSDPSVPSPSVAKVRRPPNVRRWLNVFDLTDPLAFAVGRVFDDVEDYRFATGRAWAHGGYFVEPIFHQRLAQRLRA